MKRALILLIGVFFVSQLTAQHFIRTPREPNFGFGIQVGDPLGHYDRVYDGVPVGLGLNASFPLSNWSPVELGVDLAFNGMGSNSTNVPLFDELGYYGDGDKTIRSSNNVFHLQGRFKPFNRRIRPYVDALIGFKSHKTVMDLDFDDGFEVVDLERDVLHRDFTSSMGVAFGVQIELGPHVLLDVKHQRLQGGATRLVDQSTVQFLPEGGVTYDIRTANQTNINLTQVGLTFDLGHGYHQH